MAFVLPAAATAIAAAAPAAAAASASVAASTAMAATLTSIASNMLMNFAISSAMAALNPEVGAAGRTFEWTLDPDGPIPFAAGRIGVAGSAVYRETFGPDLMYYGIPSVISGAGPIDGFESFLADDESVTFDGTGKAVSSQYAGELWYKTSLGAQPATAITSPSGLKSGATLPGWTSAHKLSGKASYMIVMGENSKGTAFPTGEIKPLVTVRGLKGWDPRLDSTYPGGSGACRLNTPSTWVYLQNPILWALKWSLGLWEGPTGKGAPQIDYQVGGIGAKLSGIDVPAFVAAANVADANSWTVAAYPTTDDDKAQVLDAFLQAGGATYAQRAGKISCIQRAAPRTSIVTISGRDTAGPLEIDTAASRIDRINTIRPRYWSEAHRWQLTALPEVTASAYQTQDGGKRTRGIDYPYVTNPVQAAQLAALQIANTREGIAGVIPLKPHLQRIRPGDAFTITEEDFVLNGVKCLCLNTDYDPATGIVRVSFVSETDAKYPFALGQSPDVPVPPVLTPVDARYVGGPLPGDWTVTPRPPATGGAQLPGFDLTGLVSNATATAMLVEYGPDPAGPWKQAYQGPPTVTNVPIDGVQPGAIYYIAISYQRGQNFSQREVYGPYTAPGLVAGDVLSTSPTIGAIKEEIDAAFSGIGDVSDALATAVSTLEAADASAADAVDAGFTAVNEAAAAQQLVVDAIDADLSVLTSKLDGVQVVVATHTNQIAGKAEYSDLAAVVVRVGDTEADIIDQATALATESGTRASETSLLRARLIPRLNRVPNGALNTPEGWTLSNVVWGENPVRGAVFSTEASNWYAVSPSFEVYPGAIETISARIEHYGVGGGAPLIYLRWLKSDGSPSDIQEYSTAVSWIANGARAELPLTHPADASRATLHASNSGGTGYTDIGQFMINEGAVAAPFNDGATLRAINAEVIDHAGVLIDLELNKVEASDFEAVRAEIEAGRAGLPSLLAQVTALNTARIEGDEVLAESIDVVEGRTAAAEASLLDVGNAIADETSARATETALIRARMVPRPNRVPGGALGTPDGWTLFNMVWGDNAIRGPVFATSQATWYAISPAFEVFAGVTETISAMIESQGVGAPAIYLHYLRSDGSPSTVQEFSPGGVWTANGTRVEQAVTHPSDAAFATLNVSNVGGSGYFDVGQLMINVGSLAAPFNDGATVGGLSAESLSHSAALVDLELNKAEASDFEAVRAEMEAARSGQPSLLAQVTALNTARVQGDESLAESIDQVAVSVGDNAANIIDLALAQADETSARADETASLRARLIPRLNRVPGGGLSSPDGWDLFQMVWGDNIVRGPVFATSQATWYAASPTFSVSPGAVETISAMIENYASGPPPAVYLQYSKADGSPSTVLPTSSAGVWATNGVRVEHTLTHPSDAARARIVASNSGGAGYVDVGQFMINAGAAAAPFNDGASVAALSAEVIDHSAVLIDLELHKAEASALTATQAQVDDVGAQTLILQESTADLAERIGDAKITIAAAAGDTPALMQLRDNRDGSLIALIAQRLLFGNYDGTTVVEAMRLVSGEVFFSRPVYIDLGTKRLIVGPGNGWVLWFGGQDKTAATATRTNGKFALGDDGEVYLGAEILGGGSFTATAPTARVKTQVGGSGPITTTSVPITVTSNTGAVTYAWSAVFGDIDGISISSASSSSPTFTASPAGVGRVQAIWAWTATDAGSGITRAGQTYVTIQREA